MSDLSQPKWIQNEIPPEAQKAIHRVKAAAYRVHRKAGAGFKESIYQRFMAHALRNDGVFFTERTALSVEFEGLRLDDAGQPDFIVENSIVVELKAVEVMHPVHAAQLINYLKASNKPAGLLINFNVPYLKHGIDQYVHPDLLRRADSDG